MPLYLYSNPNNENEIVEVIQAANDTHEYYRDGVKWDRVWTIPQASIDTKINPFSAKDFNLKTRDKKETVGSLWDRSKEASEKRESKEGIDAVKQKYYDNYSKKRRGKKHPDQRKIDSITI